MSQSGASWAWRKEALPYPEQGGAGEEHGWRQEALQVRREQEDPYQARHHCPRHDGEAFGSEALLQPAMGESRFKGVERRGRHMQATP